MVRQILLKYFEFFLKLSLIKNKHLKKIKYQAQFNDPLNSAWYLIFILSTLTSHFGNCNASKYEID